jgi:ComF family protein
MVDYQGTFSTTAAGILDRCLNNLLPPQCILCGQACGSVCICYACKVDLPWREEHCHQCGLPVDGESVDCCSSCIQIPPPFWSVVSPLIYDFPVDCLVQAFKFRRQLAAGRVLSHLIAENVHHQQLAMPDVLIPVPLHRWRRIRRGFNQSFELADYLGRILGVRVDAGCLRRGRHTSAQSGLSRKQRLKNVRDAFQWNSDRRAPAHIALVDDVMTTGTTVAECARVLQRAGAKRVDVWVAARAVPIVQA